MSTMVNVRMTDGEIAFLDGNWKNRSDGIRACISLAIDAQMGPDSAIPGKNRSLLVEDDLVVPPRNVPHGTDVSAHEQVEPLRAGPVLPRRFSNPISPPTASYLAAKKELEAAIKKDCHHPVSRRIGSLCGACGKEIK